MKTKTLSLLASALLASTCFGAGFGLYEGSAFGVANMPELMAKGGRASALYYNPAAMATSTGTVAEVGSFMVKPHLSVVGTDPYTGRFYHQSPDRVWWPIPNAYVVHQADDDLWLGLGAFSRAGLGGNFGEKWMGRYNMTQVEILSLAVNPNVAFRPTDWLAVSAGLDVGYFTIDLRQAIDVAGAAGLRPYNCTEPSPYDVFQKLDGDDWALGWDVGLQIQPVDRLSIGLAYHSEQRFTVRGTGTYRVPAAVAAMAPGAFRPTKMAGKVSLPAEWMAAAALDVTDWLTLSAGLIYSEWSCWDELDIGFKGPSPIPGVPRLHSEKDWDDVFRYTGGASIRFTDSFSGRLSFTWDQSPINENHVDYLVPADDRHIWAFGLSYETGSWTFDLTYFVEHIHLLEYQGRIQDGVLGGDFKSGSARAFAVAISHQF